MRISERERSCRKLRSYGGGGGGSLANEYIVILDLKIAVDQQNGAGPKTEFFGPKIESSP